METIKKPRKKKIVEEVKEVKKEEKKPTHNEFGVCISCQGGNPACMHNNLVEDGQKLVCALCGKNMKCV